MIACTIKSVGYPPTLSAVLASKKRYFLYLTIAGGMGGIDTVQKLLKIDADVRAIVSSGYADNSAMAEYRGYGFSGMVAKPYTIEQLRKALQDVME